MSVAVQDRAQVTINH